MHCWTATLSNFPCNPFPAPRHSGLHELAALHGGLAAAMHAWMHGRANKQAGKGVALSASGPYKKTLLYGLLIKIM